MTMILYDSLGPNPRIVRMYAAEKGLAIERRKIDIVGGETRRPDFRRKNACGSTPEIEIADGAYLSQTVANCEYLEELGEPSPLLGMMPIDRGRVRMWTRRIDLNFCAQLVLAVRASLGCAMFEPRTLVVGETAAEELKPIATGYLSELERRLAESPHLAFTDFTLAVIVVFCFVEFAVQTGLLSLDRLPKTQAWRDQTRSRPSALNSSRPR